MKENEMSLHEILQFIKNNPINGDIAQMQIDSIINDMIDDEFDYDNYYGL